MTSKPSGYGTAFLGAAERGFHVGYNQGGIFCRLPHRLDNEGHPLSLKAYGELFSLDNIKNLALSVDDVRDFVYSALASGCQLDKLPLDFTPEDVGFWLDEAPEEEPAKIFKAMGEQTVRRFQQQLERAKNAQAPAPIVATGQVSS